MSTELIKAQVSDNERIAAELVVASPESQREAVTLLSNANKLSDKITAEKEKITKPLNAALQAERARWKPLETSLACIVSTLKTKMLAYEKQVSEEQAKKEAQIMARVENGTMKVETAVAKLSDVVASDSSVTTESGMIQYAIVKKLYIVDAALIPREFLEVNESKVRDALKSGVVVPGAELREEKTIKNFR